MLNLDHFAALCNRLTIKDRDTGAQKPFRFNPSQEKIMRMVRQRQEQKKPLWAVFLKSRRLGVSTWVLSLLMAQQLQKRNCKGMIVAQLGETAKELFTQVTEFSLCLPFTLPPHTQREIYFPHSGGVSTLRRATAKTVISGRGLTLNGLHLTEAAFYPGADSFIALLNTVSSKDPDNIVAIETTANGMEGPGEAYYDYWNAAVDGQNDFMPIFLPWYEDPGSFLPDSLAPDAPADDYEKWLCAEFKVTKGQIAWHRQTLETKCGGSIYTWRAEYPACLLADTLVGTNRGIVKIRDAVPGDISELGTVTSCGMTGFKECCEIRTEQGRVLRGTLDHPVQLADGTFIHLEKTLNKKLRLLPPRFADTPLTVRWNEPCDVKSEIEITPDFARFLGVFMGDGCYTDGIVSIACFGQDVDLVEWVAAYQRKLFGNSTQRQTGPNKGCTEVRVGSVYFRHLMKKLGIYHKDKPHRRVCVPDCIWKSPKHIVKEFLSGLFEADGFNAYKDNRIKLFSKHIEFLEQIQLLLLGFGITAKISSRPVVNDRGYHYMDNNINLRLRESVEFNEQIGFLSERKKNRHRKVVPLSRRFQQITFEDTVVQVTNIGLHPVYDLSIDHKEHVFGANGIASHNTPDEAFISTGNPAFDFQEMKMAQDHIREPITHMRMVPLSTDWSLEFEEAREGPLKIFEWPKEGEHVYVGVDASKGLESGDFSAMVGWNAETGDQAFSYAAHVGPEILGSIVNYIGRMYGKAMVNVEITGGWGYIVLRELRDRWHYPGQYLWLGRDDRFDKKPRTSLGWETTERSRQRALALFRTSLRRKECFPHDQELVTQMSKCKMEMGWRWTVVKGHDDLMMAGLLGWAAMQDHHYPHGSHEDRMSQKLTEDKENHQGVQWMESPETNAFGLFGWTSTNHLNKLRIYNEKAKKKSLIDGV